MILLNFPSTYAVILLMTGGGSLPVAVEGMLPMSLQSALSRYIYKYCTVLKNYFNHYLIFRVQYTFYEMTLTMSVQGMATCQVSKQIMFHLTTIGYGAHTAATGTTQL